MQQSCAGQGSRIDFLRALREKASDGLANPLAEELADWSTAEIRAALEESLKSPACRMPGDPASRLPHFLMGAWIQRDFAAARAWFESLDPGKAKEQMASAMAIHWPRDRGGEAPWVLHRTFIGYRPHPQGTDRTVDAGAGPCESPFRPGTRVPPLRKELHPCAPPPVPCPSPQPSPAPSP